MSQALEPNMTSIAFIGGDGAGKTTIARHVTTDPDLRTKYLYMGMSAQSGDHLLPTSRLILSLRRRAYLRRAQDARIHLPTDGRLPAEEYEYSNRRRGRVWVTARLLNRFAEAWYRQIISFSYQLRGYTVVYDRHLLFDGGILDSTRRPHFMSERIYRWLMRRLYPRPDVVILLEAPGDVLHARKGEASPAQLDREARLYVSQAAAVRCFLRLDAGRRLEQVKEEAADIVAALSSPTEIHQRPSRARRRRSHDGGRPFTDPAGRRDSR